MVSDTIKLDVESIQVIENEAAKLIFDHWNEVSFYKDQVPLDVNWDKFKEHEKNGALYTFTARDNGVLIGYCVFLTVTMMHYKGTTVAMNDAVFLDKAYRKTGVGLSLINFAEAFLTKKGIDKISFHIKPTNDWSKILLRKGYAHEDSLYGKIVR